MPDATLKSVDLLTEVEVSTAFLSSVRDHMQLFGSWRSISTNKQRIDLQNDVDVRMSVRVPAEFVTLPCISTAQRPVLTLPFTYFEALHFRRSKIVPCVR